VQYTPPPAQYTPPPVQSASPPVQYTPPPVQYTPPPVQYTPPPVQYAPPPVQYAPPPVLERAEPVQPAVVLPLSRNPVRGEAPPILTGSFSGTGLDRLLRVAAARGASTLYLASLARPSMRVDGEIQMLDEGALGPSDVEALLIDLMPERNREALRSGVSTEWICDVPDVGRVRCMTFRDHRGAGGIFRMMPVRAISADQLGLSREIQALAAEPEGLVLVAGPRSSGKSTLISAFVDLINRTRRDHVITIESEIKIVHENRNSLVSQREVRGDAEEMLAVARAAIRENPDVLVIEELRTADIVTVALDAANSGHLVIGALPAHTASGAVDRIIDLYQPEYRRHVQLALAENLRGIVAQILVRKPGGGRVAAREVLLNTSAVASVIAEGKTSQLPMAIEGGRKHGMLPLNDSLVGFVQSGTIDALEAYRRAADRTGFLALLKRQGIDISFAERLA
jgi:twitching motility protein PilT